MARCWCSKCSDSIRGERNSPNMQNTCRYVTRELVQVVIYDYLQDNNIENPFTGVVPGKDWWQHFMKRSPSLSECKPQHPYQEESARKRWRNNQNMV